jgi:hypothetical protein
MIRYIIILNMALFFIMIASCSGKAIHPEEQIRTMAPQKILDLAAEKYSDLDYENARYYYYEIEKIYTNDNEENNLARAWAKYEIGYMYYQEGKKQEARASFLEVSKYKTQSLAPQLLANEMLDKLIKEK